MTTPEFELRDDAPRVSPLVRALRNFFRPRFQADLGGGGAKLPPISDIVKRAGREPRAPD